jgi:hypothetical protein
MVTGRSLENVLEMLDFRIAFVELSEATESLPDIVIESPAELSGTVEKRTSSTGVVSPDSELRCESAMGEVGVALPVGDNNESKLVEEDSPTGKDSGRCWGELDIY